MFFYNKSARVGMIGKAIIPALMVIILTFGLDKAGGQTTTAEQQKAVEQTKAVEQEATAAEPSEQITPSQPLDAIITNVTGKNVQVSRDQGKTWEPARTGQALAKDSAVRTGFASSCEVNFGTHSVLQILALSSVSIADYSTALPTEEKVQTNLLYGAVRCGVEMGRIKTDTKISTPVSTLSVRGTIIFVEYDPGTRRCLLKVDEDGPAVAGTGTRDCFGLALDGHYQLDEGMKTDCCLSRFLKLAIFERTVWINGIYAVGDVTEDEANAIVYKQFFGAVDPTSGALGFNDDRSRYNQLVPDIVVIGGGIPVGQGKDTSGKDPGGS